MLSAIITIRELAVMSLVSPRTDWLRLLEVLVKKEMVLGGISGAKWIRIARFRWIIGLSLLYINMLRRQNICVFGKCGLRTADCALRAESACVMGGLAIGSWGLARWWHMDGCVLLRERWLG